MSRFGSPEKHFFNFQKKAWKITIFECPWKIYYGRYNWNIAFNHLKLKFYFHFWNNFQIFFFCNSWKLRNFSQFWKLIKLIWKAGIFKLILQLLWPHHFHVLKNLKNFQKKWNAFNNARKLFRKRPYKSSHGSQSQFQGHSWSSKI